MKQIICITLLLTLFACQQSESPVTTVSASAWSKNNQGVGMMGSFDYDAAYQTFAELHQNYPEQRIFHQNLIVATINRQQENDESNALEQLKVLLEKDNNDLITRYLMGLLYFNLGQCEPAVEQFQWVAEKDSSDAYARYFLGQCLLQQGASEMAYDHFKSAIEIDPYLRSAYYGAFMTAQRLNQPQLAEENMTAYQKMEINPKSKLAEIKYTKMGPKAMAQANPSDSVTQTVQVKLEPLKNPFDAKVKLAKPFNKSSFTVVNQQQQKQLWVAAENSVEVYQLTSTAIELSHQITAPDMSIDDQISITDINQDGLLDGYVTSNEQQDRIYLNQGDQQWQLLDTALTDDAMMPQSKHVQIADFDHDGDLDALVLDVNGKVQLLNNNGDLSFRMLGNELIDDANNQNFIDSALLDIDGDRDLDILLLQANQLTVVVNDRMWAYQQHIHTLNFTAEQIAVNYANAGNALFHISDDNDVIHEASYDAFADSVQWRKSEFEVAFSSFGLADVNGDGADDWLLFSPEKLTAINAEDSSILQTLSFTDSQNDFHLLSSVNGPELLTTAENSLSLWPASSERHGFLNLSFTGRELAADSMRSNALGLGTEYVVYTNQQAKKQLYLNQSHHANQSFDHTNIATLTPKGNDAAGIDFMAIQWSDGVYQTELAMVPGKNIAITETQRQLSSCPVLFMDQNGEFEFLTDVMGVGAMGFLVGKDQYANPRDWEFLLLDQAQVNNSDFTFLVTEPMEETMFLDAVKMKVYETDMDIKAVLDERLSINSEQPSGDLMFYTEQWFPETIISQDGSNSTQANQHIDADSLPVGEIDLRFLGHLKSPQSHVMTFGEPLQGELILMINGWVEYGYSQTSFSAWQANQALEYPSLDAKIDGQWVTLLDGWGFPAGMPKMAAIEFKIPDDQSVTELRIRSTQEVYIDQVSVSKRIYPDAEVEALNLVHARQSVIGFPQRENGPHRFPIYDFSQLKPFDDTRHMTGAYTQLGPVEPLVTNKDNAMAIVSGGEAVTFQFEKPSNEPASGKQRFYVMEFYGWAKDMDMLTENDKYLLPLPQTGKISDEAKALNLKYNTRFMSGN